MRTTNRCAQGTRPERPRESIIVAGTSTFFVAIASAVVMILLTNQSRAPLHGTRPSRLGKEVSHARVETRSEEARYGLLSGSRCYGEAWHYVSLMSPAG